jgi:hypothetical protein
MGRLKFIQPKRCKPTQGLYLDEVGEAAKRVRESKR